jgi:RND family efflux transporter MFP subunit
MLVNALKAIDKSFSISIRIKQRSWGMLLLFILLTELVACSEQAPEPMETVRAIRTITVAEPASSRIRRFSGVVEAADATSVSFEVPGIVQEVNVEVGDNISKDQVLAVLDGRTFRLKVEAAQAAVGRAEAERRDALNDWDRLRRIAERDRGAVSERSVERAEAMHKSAQKNLRYHKSRLDLANQDLERTVLRAPFGGIVASRYVEPFQQVALGQKVFNLFIEGVMEAAINIPESEIKQVHLGLQGEIRFPAFPGQIFKGTVSEISRVAGAANAFPVKLTINADSTRIRPGITAEVTLLLGDEYNESAFLIPIGALVPGRTEADGYVFVFDTKTSTVKKTAIESDSIRGSHIIVNKGLKAGDIIAVAGVSFLRDGQKVRLSNQ